MNPSAEHHLAGSTAHRVRGVLAIPAFRRLWGVTALTATAEWLSLLALSAVATQLTTGYQAQSFALGAVVATKLLPAMVLGPLAGALADKLDRRHVMVVCDVLRAGLFLSIPLVGELAWLFVATFLIEVCALFWIPAKDASIPNLLRRPDQVETANQLSLIMTYGVAVLVASGVFTVLSKLGPVLSGTELIPGAERSAYLALTINGIAYAFCALVVGTRIPEISGRAVKRRRAQPGLLSMLRDGVVFVHGTPLVRGLVTGIIGAFAAGGAVIACAKLYATSLGGGNAAYGLLFASLFVGLGLGMAFAPQAARRIRHRRLFGLAIVGAGLALVTVALAPHLIAALAAVILVGCAAGVAFLTGLTIIGAQVADEMRGRTIAFVQSLVRLVLLASMALVPLAVGLVQQRTLTLLGERVTIDGTRPVLLCAGLLAAALGLVAHRQMDDRLDGSLLGDLRAALRRRAEAGLPGGRG
jgi:dTMP kinase